MAKHPEIPILDVCIPEFINTGFFDTPYCYLNEKMMLSNLSAIALDHPRQNKWIKSSVVISGNPYNPRTSRAKILTLPHNYFSYQSGAGLVLSSQRSEFNGLIVGPNLGVGRIAGRPFFGDAIFSPRHISTETLGSHLHDNCNKLELDYNQPSLVLLLALLDIINFDFSPDLTKNIKDFSDWYKTHFEILISKTWQGKY